MAGPSPDLSPAELMATLDRFVDGEIVVRLRAAGFLGVTPSHGRVFEALYGNATRITDLARHAGMTKQAMGEVIRGLERHGYVRRDPDPRDGRATLVMLTRKGRASIDLAVQVIAEIEGRWAARLGERRYRALHRALRELAADDQAERR